MIRRHDEPIRTQYAELKERARAAGPLLAGSPGSIVKHVVKGRPYIYRVYYVVASKRLEEYVGPADDDELKTAMALRMEYAEWMRQRVVQLRDLGFQVADRLSARVLVEMHNRGAFDAGMVLVGTLAYMARLNDLGVAVLGSRTMDIDLARASHLKLGMRMEFLAALQATSLPFVEVPGLDPRAPSTSAKLPGAGALRVDVLTSGAKLGAPVRLPELSWYAQSVPFYDYLLKEAEPGAVLAGGHCIPVRIPQAGRFIWHKLYSSRNRRGESEKARKDLQQAVTLGRALQEDAPGVLKAAYRAAPPELKKKLSTALPGFTREFKLDDDTEIRDALRSLRT
ncbi:MAG: GSU2403 family nucleotidyltransferase fold protein [Steroidobacteraceae bacterium]